VHQKDAQKGGVRDLCIKKMHRKEGYVNCASKRCTERGVHDLCIKKMHRMQESQNVHQIH
jgi:hypothetical protein